MPASHTQSIVFVTHYTDLYGANRSMLNLIEGLKQKGIKDISVIVPHKGEVCNKLKQLLVSYHIVPFVIELHSRPQSYLKKIAKKYYNLLLVKKYQNLFSHKKNLIIHTNSSVNFFGAYLAHYLRVPHVWHIREFGKEDYNLEYNFGEAYFLKWINRAAAVICISKALSDHRFKEKMKPFLRVIYNGVVPLDALYINIIPGTKNKTFRFGISGHISKEKNQEEAIEAFNLMLKNYDCELLIAGTGSDSIMHQLQKTIKKYRIEHRIQFKGFINDILPFYESLDCLLMCAKNEALGRVTIEAMSKGLPVIGFNNAGTAEIIKNGYNGLLYNNSYIELAEKMGNIMHNYKAFTEMRKHAVQTVKENFTIEACAKNVADVYDSVFERY